MKEAIQELFYQFARKIIVIVVLAIIVGVLIGLCF